MSKNNQQIVKCKNCNSNSRNNVTAATLNNISFNTISNNNVNNLRWCNYQENQWNSKLSKNNTSSVKGVYFNKKAKKYSAHITIDRHTVYLGYFENIEDAITTNKYGVYELIDKSYNDLLIAYFSSRDDDSID